MVVGLPLGFFILKISLSAEKVMRLQRHVEGGEGDDDGDVDIEGEDVGVDDVAVEGSKGADDVDVGGSEGADDVDVGGSEGVNAKGADACDDRHSDEGSVAVGLDGVGINDSGHFKFDSDETIVSKAGDLKVISR